MRIAFLVLAACGGGSHAPPDAKPLGDFSAAAPEFRPTTQTISQVVGVSYQLPGEQTPAAQAIRAFTEQQMQQAGVHGARADLTWSIVEPTRGAIDWSWYHTKVDGYASAGVTTLPILCFGNPWANAMPTTEDRPPDDPADFAAYAGAAASEFHLPVYEIWNEENLGFRFWQPHEDADAYGTLLAAASRAIRAADPNARVMLGGLLDLDELNLDAETYIQLLYRAHPDIAGAYDILGIHPYPLYPPAVAPEVDDDTTGEVSAPRMIARLRADLAYWGDDPNRPIWATEIGWPTYKNVDEELQARWTVRAALLLAGAGVDRVFFYTMYDGPNPTAYPPEDAFGLFHYADATTGTFQPTPKLAWTALANLLALAGPLAVATDVTSQLAGAPPDAHAYRLVDPTGASARSVTIVWRADDTAAPSTVTVPAGSGTLQVFDLYGAALPVSATVPLSGRPVFVVEGG